MTFLNVTVISCMVGVGLIELARGLAPKVKGQEYREFSGVSLWIHAIGILIFSSSFLVLLGALVVGLVCKVLGL